MNNQAHYDLENVFAKILRGEIPSTRIYEDEHTIAIMDVMPQAPGHVLVIPRSASRNLLDADTADLARLLPVVQRIARAAQLAFAADGITVMQFNGAAGGQSVYHLHFHVIPRNAGVPLRAHTGQMEAADVLAAHADRLQTALATST